MRRSDHIGAIMKAPRTASRSAWLIGTPFSASS